MSTAWATTTSTRDPSTSANPHPARGLPVRVGERRRPERQAPGGMVSRRTCSSPRGVNVGVRRLHERRRTDASFSPTSFDPFHVADLVGRRSTPRRRRSPQDRRDRRDRAPRCDRRDPHRADRAAHRLRGRVSKVDVGHRRPHRPPGPPPRPNGVLVTENRSKGVRFTRVRHGHRPGQGQRRLQDGRLPQAVEHRRHARTRNPGGDGRA